MADDGILNKGSKYLLAVNEDQFGVQKWLRFENPNGSFPPTGAVHFEDFIAIGAAGDSLSGGGSEKTFYQDDFTGLKYENDSISSCDPSVNMIGGLDDLRFLLRRFMRQTVIPITPPDAATPMDTFLLSGDVRADVKSLTLYGGVYEDKESSVRGCQIDEVDITFSKADGVIPINLTMYGSKFKLGELKPQGVVNNLRAPPIEGWNIDSIFIDLSINENNHWIENDAEWEQIGCDVTEFELDIKNNLDTDTGATICSSFGNTSNLSDFTTLNRFRGKLVPSDNVDIQLTLTKKQNNAFWKQLALGGIGNVEVMDDQPYPLKVVFYNVNGAVLVLGFPGVATTTDSPNLTTQADEQVTLDQIQPGSFILNTGGQELEYGNMFAHFYPDAFYSSQGIGFAQLVTGPNSNDNAAMSRIIIQRTSDDHIVSMLDLAYEKFEDQGGIKETKIKLYRGEYQAYIRLKADPNTKVPIGNPFTITADHTVNVPFCLNSVGTFGSADYFGYPNCVVASAQTELSPNPIDIEPEVEERDNEKDI